MRRPGIEPGSTAWRATMLTFTPATPLRISSICFSNEFALQGAAGVKVSIEASQALDRGSIPRRRSVFFKNLPNRESNPGLQGENLVS